MKDWLEQTFDTPEKRAKFYVVIVVAHIASIVGLVVGGIFLVLWALGYVW